VSTGHLRHGSFTVCVVGHRYHELTSFRQSKFGSAAWARVVRLAFLKPHVEILAFMNAFGFFGNQQNPEILRLFSVGKAWLWQNIV